MKKYRLALLTLVPVLFAGCAPTEAVRGSILQDFQISEIRQGVDTQSDVMRKLGSPTSKAPFDNKIWYYIGQKTEKSGILDPKVTSEKIIIVTFDEAGTVASIENRPPDRTEIPYVSEKTPTSGQDLTVMQQLLGNMGRFNKDAGKQGSGGVGSPTGGN